jgi:parvulin-like peptidyl-prolyl isomerase
MLCLVAVLAIFVLQATSLAEQVDVAPVNVVKVGNILISEEDVNKKTQRLLPMQVSFHGSITADKIADVKEKALKELIDRAYKVQYAIDDEVSIDAVAFENDWQDRLSKNPQAASAQASQLNKVRADLYLNQLARRAEEVAVDQKIAVSEEAVSDYYKINKEKYYRPKLYTASHVFVKVDPSDNAEELDEKKTRAETLYKRAVSGEDFYNLAYYESDDRSKFVGGSLGSFHAGQTVPEFDATIQAMKPGDIVGPVRTMYGFHVIKLDSVDVERQMEFSEVSAKIRKNLEEEQREKLYEQWMSELKVRYPVEHFDR